VADEIQRRPSDVGGLPAGPIDREEHGYADWERRIDALSVVLIGAKFVKPLPTLDERRRSIESMPPHLYNSLRYYEKWSYSLCQTLIQRGIITTEELQKKMVEVEKRG
jgi:hypothetical protein